MEEFVDGEKKTDRGAAEAKQLWRGTRGRRTEALIFADYITDDCTDRNEQRWEIRTQEWT
jgi:hypothetical protein